MDEKQTKAEKRTRSTQWYKFKSNQFICQKLKFITNKGK